MPEPQDPQVEPEVVDSPPADDPVEPPEGDEPDTFPRSYVEELRAEAAENRVKAKRADALASRLHLSLVEKTGRLADPTDLPFDEAHLDDEEALTAAIDALLAAKPHLASRIPAGDVGQGERGDGDEISLSGLLRARA